MCVEDRRAEAVAARAARRRRAHTCGMDYPTKDEMNAAIAGLEARMDARPTKDEMKAAIAGLEARMDALRNELSAKIEKGISETIKWVVGLAFAGAMAIVTLMTYTLNNATPKAAPPTPPPAPAAQAPVPSVVIMEAPRAQ